jgi:hypothetical protein
LPPVKIPNKKVIPKKTVQPVSAPKTPALPLFAPAVQSPVVPYVPPAPPVVASEWSGTDTAVTHAGQIVIHNDHQWIKFWAEHHPDEAAPDVDFSQNMVVGVFAGDRPADKFAIRIVAVRTESNALIVNFREQIPPPGTFEIGVSVYPYDLKVIPKSDLPVKFRPVNPQETR